MDWDEFANFMFLQRSTTAARSSWRFLPPRDIRRPPFLRRHQQPRPTSHAQPMAGLCLVDADVPAYASYGDDCTVRYMLQVFSYTQLTVAQPLACWEPAAHGNNQAPVRRMAGRLRLYEGCENARHCARRPLGVCCIRQDVLPLLPQIALHDVLRSGVVATGVVRMALEQGVPTALTVAAWGQGRPAQLLVGNTCGCVD